MVRFSSVAVKNQKRGRRIKVKMNAKIQVEQKVSNSSMFLYIKDIYLIFKKNIFVKIRLYCFLNTNFFSKNLLKLIYLEKKCCTYRKFKFFCRILLNFV